MCTKIKQPERDAIIYCRCLFNIFLITGIHRPFLENRTHICASSMRDSSSSHGRAAQAYVVGEAALDAHTHRKEKHSEDSPRSYNGPNVKGVGVSKQADSS